jgi:hypothetical protein
MPGRAHERRALWVEGVVVKLLLTFSYMEAISLILQGKLFLASTRTHFSPSVMVLGCVRLIRFEKTSVKAPG